MRLRWRLILPILGLIVFSAESFHSLQLNRGHRTAPKYFYWSFLPLDSDPLNGNAKAPNPDNGWELRSSWIDPGYLTKALILSAFPAFILGTPIVKFFAHLGISEVLSFAITMPVLISAWFYVLGGLIDYWVRKRSHRGATSKWGKTYWTGN
jgi:hypothetical protein